MDPRDFNNILGSTELRSHQCQGQFKKASKGETTKWMQAIINHRVLTARKLSLYHYSQACFNKQKPPSCFLLSPRLHSDRVLLRGLGESFFGNKTLHERKFESNGNAKMQYLSRNKCLAPLQCCHSS